MSINIFDRLNRNGEALNGQELRKSTYHGTPLLELVEKLARNPFWKERLAHTDVARMEDYEFLSELLFQVIEGKALHANQSELDQLYKKYTNAALNWKEVEEKFIEITAFLSSLNLDFDKYRIGGVSHLYGLWCLANLCLARNVPVERIADKVRDFYEKLRTTPDACIELIQYKKSMSARTKDRGQREKRLAALADYAKIKLE